MHLTRRGRVTAIALSGALAVSMSVPTLAQDAGADPSPTPRPPGAWFFAVEPGMCFDDVWLPSGDYDFGTLPVAKDCDLPHDNEVVALVPLADSDEFPAGDLGSLVRERCAPAYEEFLGWPSSDWLVPTTEFWPIESDWDAGARDIICGVYGQPPLVGTMRSGGLRIPDQPVAVYHEEAEDVPDIWLLDATTGVLRRNLTNSRVRPLLDIPSWRPDRGAVAFAARQAGSEDNDIHEVDIATGEIRPLVVRAGQQDGPSYAPDGRRLAYISRDGDAEYDIHVLDLTTGVDRRLTTDPARDSTPEWSPDGERLAFRRVTDGVSQLWVMDADGSDQTQLTFAGGGSFDPRWSPDGASILFSTDRDGNDDIWLMDTDGTNQRPLTTHPGRDLYPAWSSDGSAIVFQSERYGGVTLWVMRADGTDQSLLSTSSPVGWPRPAPASWQVQPG
ncbi:MAG: PD40 domain-containing protein [Chloroflexi bacterium]|nr:PD40 domain-containing protein [Chloroflexota bacterium]